MKYIDTEKLIAEIEIIRQMLENRDVRFNEVKKIRTECMVEFCKCLLDVIASLQQEQPENMIQWTGNNLKEVIDFTGKSPRFGEWFKSWDEYENYVHTHNDILKLFCEDGSHYEVPTGAWIVKTPDGYNVPSISRFVQEQPEVDLEKEIKDWCDEKITGVRPIYTGDSLRYSLLPKTARHFYELGLNARKEK